MSYLEKARANLDGLVRTYYETARANEAHSRKQVEVLEQAAQSYALSGIAEIKPSFERALGHVMSGVAPREFFLDLAEVGRRPLVTARFTYEYNSLHHIILEAPRGKDTENVISPLLLLSGQHGIGNDSSRQRWRFYFHVNRVPDAKDRYKEFKAAVKADPIARMILNIPK